MADTGGVDVGVVGFGRAGAAVAVALAAAGHRVVGVSARSERARERARRHLPASRLLPAHELAAAVDVLLLAVSDDAIAPVAAEIAVNAPVPALAGGSDAAAGDEQAAAAGPDGPGGDGPRPGLVVAHLSGRHGLAPLAPLAERGAARAAIHPIMTMAGDDPAADAEHLRGTTFGLTADPAAAALAHRLVGDIGGRAVDIADADRTLYHAAIVFGANYLAALAGASADLLAGLGVPRAREAIAPLLRVSLDNALRTGDAATTGPVRRGDAGTVAAHLDALRAAGPGLVPSYVTLAELTATRLTSAGLLPAEAAAALRRVLGQAAEGITTAGQPPPRRPALDPPPPR
ncbi:MAG: DUF2520 domain-containing protein [Frankia sp.]|nr:DUF2520 domain-containing protein [Frankia sp.]